MNDILKWHLNKHGVAGNLFHKCILNDSNANIVNCLTAMENPTCAMVLYRGEYARFVR